MERMMTATAIKFRRETPGRYHAANGADVLDDDFLSAVVARDRENRDWMALCYYQFKLVHEDYHPTCREAKEVAGRVLAQRDAITGRPAHLIRPIIKRLATRAAIEVIDEDIARMEAEMAGGAR